MEALFMLLLMGVLGRLNGDESLGGLQYRNGPNPGINCNVYEDSKSEVGGGNVVCGKNKICKFCSNDVFKACIIVVSWYGDIGLYYCINGNKIFQTALSAPNPPPLCKMNLPFVVDVTNICMVVFNVTLSGTRSACVNTTFQVSSEKHRRSVNVACFSSPPELHSLLSAETSEVEGNPTPPELDSNYNSYAETSEAEGNPAPPKSRTIPSHADQDE